MDVNGVSTSPYQGKNLSVALIVFTFVLQVLFFTPIQVVIQNAGEFLVAFSDLLVLQFTVSLAVGLVLLLVVRILEFHIVTAGLTFFSLVAWLESWFFYRFAGHDPLAGNVIDWQALQWLSRIEVGTLLVLGILFVVFRRQLKLLSRVSLTILLLLTIAFVFNTVIKLDSLKGAAQVEATDSSYLDQFYRLSKERNVIHIVPDQAQGAMLHDILVGKSGNYAEMLDGFTLFKQAVGGFQGSYPAVIFNMSGEAPGPQYDRIKSQSFSSEYTQELLQERSIVSVLSHNAFKTFGFQPAPDVFCKAPYTACAGSQGQVFSGEPLDDPDWRLAVAAVTSVDLALFRLSPIKLRSWIYDDGRWFAQKLAKYGSSHSGALDYFTQSMQVEDGPGTYNYIYHAGAHAPLLFDRNCNFIGSRSVNSYTRSEQVRCMLKQLGEMIGALKQAGIYDQTMIVVSAARGTTGLPESMQPGTGRGISPDLMGMASTFLLIKPPGMRGSLTISNKPATIGDVPVTIADAFGLDHSFPGEGLFNKALGADRQREFFTYDPSAMTFELQDLANLTRYRIRGDVFNERSWVLPITADTGRYFSQLRVDHPQFTAYSSGFSAIEQHRVPIRWVEGTRALALLSAPSYGAVYLEFESFVPQSITGQTMEIRVGGVLIQKLEQADLENARHSVRLPDDLPREELLEIEFSMGKTVKSGNDLRSLSVLFSYIGLVTSD